MDHVTDLHEYKLTDTTSLKSPDSKQPLQTFRDTIKLCRIYNTYTKPQNYKIVRPRNLLRSPHLPSLKDRQNDLYISATLRPHVWLWAATPRQIRSIDPFHPVRASTFDPFNSLTNSSRYLDQSF